MLVWLCASAGAQGDDHGDSLSAATQVSLPSQTSGEIDPGDDEDHFRFEVPRRGEVVARTTGGLDTVGALYDSTGRQLATDDDGGDGFNFRIQRELDAGTHYVSVSSFLTSTGAYTLDLSIRNAGGGAEGGVQSGGYRRALGDFNGDGREDVLLRHEDGRWYYYPMNGRQHMAGRGIANLTRNLEWSVAGIGDFNGDGRDDVLLRKPGNGAWYYYPMDGRRHMAGQGTANLTSNLEWSVAGIGDFNGDGRDDVLLRKPGNGRWYYYPMNGRQHMAGQGTANLTSNLEWSVAGIGDFNGDGRDDVLLRKPGNGAWYYYPMDGRRHMAGQGGANLTRNLEWSVAGVGDLNGDGRDDVLLRKPGNGAWYYYPMDGRRHMAGQGAANLTRNLEWSVAGIGDLNGDGRDDVLLRKPGNGRWYYYPMNGRRHMAGQGTANLTSNRAWSGLFRGDGANGTPAVGTGIPNRSLAPRQDSTLDLSAHFSDDQPLAYEASSSDAEVLRVSVTGSVLTLMPVAEGSATVTVTARDPDGNAATQTFSVTVGGVGVGERFRDCDVCPEMVVVLAGSFMMGAPGAEVDSTDNERPVHPVSVPSFAVGVHEVTFEEWDACAADGGCGGDDVEAYLPYDEGWGRGSRPVIHVSWNDAQTYVDWLSSRTGERYRLPSESEWEYVARAGTTTPFHTGATITTDQANYHGWYSYPDGSYDQNRTSRLQTVPVGSFGANAWGLHDVHGNVFEWTEDCWNDDYDEGAPSDGSAWLTGSCDGRVLRGGSWSNNPASIRSAYRLWYIPAGARGENIGFRVARTLTP